ncbi:acetyl-CoA C-acetyltransferase [Lysinibacillus endophyticus]|uniref:acetyl-CoA C-acetyltransferase n=1 Tax=Ureibacillus endophyticus TaxID=1978490 RepID=UPI0020A0E878|nr:acetyl-CoA C-acetyltransferase [Lysinibacillus endophyticus]
MMEIVILNGARTPFTNISGTFKYIGAIDLGAIASKEAIKKSGIDPKEIDHVVFGNVHQSSKDALFFARHVGLKSEIPIEVPAVTVNRLCGTGIEALISAARLIKTGEAQVVLAGGAESMSQVPHVVKGMRSGTPLGSTVVEDWLWEGLNDTVGGCSMAETAENLASKYNISREEVDLHALTSHERALNAIEKGYFAEEIVPVTISTRKGDVVIENDDHVRKSSLEQLAKLKPRFVKDGVVTPANASGMVDGAAAMIVASSEYAKANNLQPIARLVSWDVVGVEPKYMGIGPVPAIQSALRKADLTLDDIDLIEINEAFSAQYLACQKELGFDLEIGNVNGGAVAIGHPLAASGTRISLTLLYELRRRNAKYGVSAVCIGGGQGIAAVWENLKS